jgi:hypothetical protein
LPSHKTQTMKRLVLFFKRKYAKAKIWFKKQSQINQKENTENERMVSTICRKLINHSSSKFLIAPLSGKRYIKNTELGLFIIMNEGRVSLTNHVYHYDVFLIQKDWERLVRMYDNRTERDREIYETEIRSQIVYSLSNVLDKLNQDLR